MLTTGRSLWVKPRNALALSLARGLHTAILDRLHCAFPVLPLDDRLNYSWIQL